MYCTLTDPKLLRRLSHRRIVFYYIISDLHGSLLNIIFQKNPPANIIFTMYAGEVTCMQSKQYSAKTFHSLYIYCNYYLLFLYFILKATKFILDIRSYIYLFCRFRTLITTSNIFSQICLYFLSFNFSSSYMIYA